MAVYLDRPVGQRLVSCGLVAALHAAVIGILLAQTGTRAVSLPTVLRGIRIVAPRPPPPMPPPLPPPKLLAPALAPLAVPQIEASAPPSQPVPRAVSRMAPTAGPAAHFGPASDDAGLGVQEATISGGGARGRGSLADFQVAVRRAVLARRVQPHLPWDRRDTCVINYTVSVARDGALAALSVDPCGVPEINEAAAAAIRAAAPFPPPPDLGSARTEVHGTLIYRP